MSEMPGYRLLNSGPFRFGFITTLGVLLALVLGLAIGSLTYALTLIFFALFVSLGLYPLVLKLESLKFSRTGAVLTVMGIFIVVVGLLLWRIIPNIVEQAGQLIKYIPAGLDDIEHQEWFLALNETFGGGLLPFVQTLQQALSDPAVWIAIGGGALHVSVSIVNGTFGAIFVVALTLYFVASLETMKHGLYSLVPASRRAGFSEIAEEIFQSVGKYLSGMFLLALINAAFSFVLLTILGVPWAGILAAFAIVITFIPVVGSLISASIMTVVSLFTSPTTGLIVGIVMFVYLQLEAYVLTPRIVGKAIRIPGSLVLIGAMVGATLLGLLGALVACPVSASILLITKKVIVPTQNER
ncbi:MAG: AI-2E family transporter [Microbacteriaceae bacterium]|nr:AI-2E family transporter [Microbacteriaceae bacterium]HOB58099.1 AI-2E family transporter [Rhodoglobus sp.]HOT34568.1 AI-2E family transporter [Rhodoglobus sp.]HOW00629.1 AI-2E family transporter [Rhodoglobus sp.]HOY81582.1 AI-2E family transporter [Rhodoglobus sp.]